MLAKELADRGSFDATCLEQLQAAFASGIAGLDEQLAAGAPGKAERAAAVQQTEAAAVRTLPNTRPPPPIFNAPPSSAER